MIALSIVTSAAAIVFAILFWRYRARLYDQLGRDPRSPIRTVHLDEFDALFAHDELGPTQNAEVAFIGRGRGVVGGTSDREAWVLGVLAKKNRFMFEFGTATGKSTYLLARNSPADAHVVSITLSPHDLNAYRDAHGDSANDAQQAKEESRFTSFRYTGTDVAHKVEQLFGDTKDFDPAPYRRKCDFIFIDGSHAWSYVVNDTHKALEMLAPNGVILWHDYRGRWGRNRDVYRALNALRHELPLVRLAETSFVAYRSTATVPEVRWPG
jgi:predicted O-methyltransferase YrrM